MPRIGTVLVVVAVMMVGACGSSEESNADTIAAGGGPLIVSDGNLEIEIATAIDRGDSITTSSGTLSVDTAKRDTHTLFEFPITASVVSGDQWGLTFESLVFSSGAGDADTAFICSDAFCGGSTSSFGVFSGSDGEFTVYVVAPSDAASFSVEFAGAAAWPPAGAGAPEAPEAPAPAATVVEVEP